MMETGMNTYLLIFLLGTLPTIVWRFMGVYFAEKIDEDSEALHWVKTVASALIAALVARIMMVPAGQLAQTAFSSRLIAMAIGVAVFARLGLGPAICSGLVTLYLLETFGFRFF